jgi:hypothetical protein
MDRLTAKLRTMVLDHQVELIDVYHGRHIQFIAHAVENGNSGIRTIKGNSPFEIIYVPEHVVSELIEKRFCTYKSRYDTSFLEYQIRICEE